MTSSQNFDLIKTALTTLGRKEYDAASAYFSADCEYTNVPLGTVRGPQGVKEVLEPFFAPTIENEFVWKRVAFDGVTVMVERVDRHHLPDGWVELPIMSVFEVHNGKICVWRDYFDAATIMSKWPAA